MATVIEPVFGIEQLQRVAHAGAVLDQLLDAIDSADECPGLARLTGDEVAELFACAATITRQIDLVQALAAQRVDASGVWPPSPVPRC